MPGSVASGTLCSTSPEFCWHSLTDFSYKVHEFLLCSCLTRFFFSPGAECFWDSAHSSWKFSWLSKLFVVFLYQRCLHLSSKLRGCKIVRPDGQHSGNHQCGLASSKFYGPITANDKDVLKSLIHKAIWTHIEVYLKSFFFTYRIVNLNVFKLPDIHKILFLFQEIRKLAEGSETFSPTTVQLYQQLGKQVQSRSVVHLYICLWKS